MKIVFFTDSFHPFISGVTFALLNQANELTRRGHDVWIFRPKPLLRTKESAPENIPTKAKIYNIPVAFPTIRHPELHITFPTFLWSFFRVRQINPDVIHTHTEWGCAWEGVAVAKTLKKPVVGTFHTFWADPAYLEHFHLPKAEFMQKLMWLYCRTYYNRLDHVLAPSGYVKEQLEKRDLKSTPQVVSNGIDMPELVRSEEIEKTRNEKGISSPSFIYVGRVSQEKTLTLAIDAFAKIKEAHSEATFVIVGGGPSENEIRAYARDKGVAESVIFLGRVPHEQLIRENLFRLGDIFITASTTENQPISILEAMSFGLPVVGPAAKGIPELVHNGHNGFLFEPEDLEAMTEGLRKLYEDAELRQDLSENARQTAEQNSITEIGRILEDIYENLPDPSNG